MNSKNIHDPQAARESEKYTHPIPSREYILSLFKPQKKILSRQQLIKLLNLDTPTEQEALGKRLRAMRRDGQLIWIRGKGYSVAKTAVFIKGTVVSNKEGFGFVIPEDNSPDLFLSVYQMRQVFHNDRVLVRVIGEGKRGRREATIVEVLDRNTDKLVGQYIADQSTLKVIPSQSRIHQEIIIPAGSQADAIHKQIVLVEIIHQPDLHHSPTGRIIKVLSDAASIEADINIATHQYQLPHEWPKEVQKEINGLKKHFSAEDEKRVDLRHLPFVTIDGEDSKDFDDAVYCKKEPRKWKLWVAIADVSHYVHPDTALDKEAYLRGNSVYFPDQVLPMLPDILSNDWCSLKPQTDRPCLVCEMSISMQGNLKEYRFYPATIHSHARLTYTQVTHYLETNQYLEEHQHLCEPLKNLSAIFEVLLKARQKRGAIDFDFPETYIQFNADKEVENIVPKIRSISHRIIEECMLVANVAAARFLLENKIPSLFRLHESPSTDKLSDLKTFLNYLGIQFNLTQNSKPLAYSEFLKSIAAHPDSHLIQVMFLRAMSQAVYSPKNKGHFGLAYSEYAHFTSPIRRYPDLLVHRAIYHVLSGKIKTEPFYYNVKTLEEIGEHCSMTERRADEATRSVTTTLKCRFMANHIGECFEGIISHVTHFGLFITLQKNLVEGLVHISHLEDDHYVFDASQMVLQGQRKGKIYRLGDKVTVQIARVNIEANEIDLALK
jgi:ribonuclease R